MRGLKRAWAWVQSADRFIRLHFLSFSFVWPLMGAASVSPDLTAGQALVLLGVALCFNGFAMVLNDIVDLPADRTDPRRQDDPLVRGVVHWRQALLFVLAQPVLTIPLTIGLGGGWRAQATLLIGFAAMAAYDLWGKRCRLPQITDAIQGVAWASLAVYAAQAVGGQANPLTWLVAGYAVGFTLVFNGVHGPLRDLRNDYAHDARTTAIHLGVRPGKSATADPLIPALFVAYAWLLLFALLAIQVAVLARNDFGYGLLTWTVTAILAAIWNAAIVALYPTVVRPRGEVWQTAFRLHLYLLTMSLPLTFIAQGSRWFSIALLSLTAFSVSLFDATPRIASWVWHNVRSALGRTAARQPAAIP
jgi:4-hydroxybenzoate polyprenyltransferase